MADQEITLINCKGDMKKTKTGKHHVDKHFRWNHTELLLVVKCIGCPESSRHGLTRTWWTWRRTPCTWGRYRTTSPGRRRCSASTRETSSRWLASTMSQTQVSSHCYFSLDDNTEYVQCRSLGYLRAIQDYDHQWSNDAAQASTRETSSRWLASTTSQTQVMGGIFSKDVKCTYSRA